MKQQAAPASSRYPGVVFDLRQKLLARVGTGTTGAAIRRLRRLGTRVTDEEWLRLCAALASLVDLADGKSRAELDAQVRDFLQQLGSDDDDAP